MAFVKVGVVIFAKKLYLGICCLRHCHGKKYIVKTADKDVRCDNGPIYFELVQSLVHLFKEF